MQDLQQSARQSKSLARKKRGKAAMRRARKVKPYLRAALPTPERVRARAKTERFEVDQERDWLVVRADPRRASRCAQTCRKAGLPVFEARQEERLVAENGKARVAQVPILRRLLFVGMAKGEPVGDLSFNRWVEAVWAKGEVGLIWTPREWLETARPVRIGPRAMQKFADHITGHRRGDKLVDELIVALFAVGDMVRVKDGPFATYEGAVEEINPSRGRHKVSIEIFGRQTPIEVEETSLEAA